MTTHHPSSSPPSFASVAVIGAGTMGTSIALVLIKAGLPVVLSDQSGSAADRAATCIAGFVQCDVEKARSTAAEADARLARQSTREGLEGVGDADLIIEAVFEDMDVKREVFVSLDRTAEPSAVLASNTSTLDLIAGFTRRPAQMVGLHFFSLAHVMKLVEVVRGVRTSSAYADSLGLAHGLARIQSYHFGREGWAFTPAPLLVQLARRGESFGSPES